MINIEEFKKIRAGRHLIVLDASILLELYQQPSNISLDVIEIFLHISENIYIPYHVYEEFKRNHVRICGAEKRRFKRVRTELTDTVIKLQNEIGKHVTEYHKHNYTDIKELQDRIDQKIDETKSIINDYETSHSKEIQANLDFLDGDKINEFVEELKRRNRVGRQIPFTEKMQIIKEGEIRFVNLIPPGYMDSEKSGMDKYGDLFIWKTVLKIAKEETANIFFLTNDVKEDWWKQEKGEPIELREELVEEFEELNPHLEVHFLTLEKAFSYLSEELQMGNSKSALQLSAMEVVKELIDSYDDDIMEQVQQCLMVSSINEFLEEEFLECGDENIYWIIENVSVEKNSKIITYYIDLDISVLGDLTYREPGDYPYDAGKIAITLSGDMVISKEEYGSSSKLEQIEAEILEYAHIEPEIWNTVNLSLGKEVSCKKIIQSNKSIENYKKGIEQLNVQMTGLQEGYKGLVEQLSPYYEQYNQVKKALPPKELIEQFELLQRALPPLEIRQKAAQIATALQGNVSATNKGED